MNQISQIYSHNKFFHFHDQFKLKLNKVLFDNFNLAYNELHENNKLKIDEINNIKNKLLLNLDLIFKDFNGQINDDYEYKEYLHEYLNELLKLVAISIENNIKIYTFKNKNKFDQKKIEEFQILNNDKYIIKNLSFKTQKKITAICDKKIKYFKNLSSNKVCSRKEMTLDSGFDIKRIIYLLNKNFNYNGTNKLVSQYMNCEYEVTGCALEFSPSNANWWQGYGSADIKTKYIHLDNSSINPKAICYLSDVNLENGPTSFFPRVYENLEINYLQDLVGRNVPIISSSKNLNKLKKIIGNDFNFFDNIIIRKLFMCLPEEFLFNSHIGWDIPADSFLEKKLLNSEKTFTGNAGSYVLFDGAKLFHRGGMVKSGHRIALQIVFGKRVNIHKKFITLIINAIKKIYN